eukprot:GILK01007420.1.p1 GENE.GILK01007420.1~~GILK01007420.1.p1  ORF type:complete len:246 (+),score=17.68 GILK01007420.1:45-782(+)
MAMVSEGYVPLLPETNHVIIKEKFQPIVGPRFILFVVLIGLYFSLNVSALSTPWWVYSAATYSSGGAPSSWQRLSAFARTFCMDETKTTGLVTTCYDWYDTGLTNVTNLAAGIFALQISALFCCIGMVFLLLLQRYAPYFKQGAKLFWLVFGLLLVMMLLNTLAVPLFAGLLPSFVDQDYNYLNLKICTSSESPCDSFTGTTQVDKTFTRWGPGAGWYCAVFNVPVALCILLLLNKCRVWFAKNI